MDKIANLKKTLSPIQQGLEQHRAALCAEYGSRHSDYMHLNRQLRDLNGSPPHGSEVEALLSEYLETFLDKARVEFSRCTAPWRYASDCAEGMRDGRKVTMDMLRADPTMAALLMIATPALRASIPAAVAALGWEFGPSPAERERAIADLQGQLEAVSSELGVIAELALSVGLRSEDLPR